MVIKRFFYFLEIMSSMVLLLTGCQKENEVPAITSSPESIQQSIQSVQAPEGTLLIVTQAPVQPELTKEPQQATSTPKETLCTSPQASVPPEFTQHPIQSEPTPEPVPPVSTQRPSQTAPATGGTKPVPSAETIDSEPVIEHTDPVPTKEPAQSDVLPSHPPVLEIHTHEFEMSVWELPTCSKGGYYNNVCKTCGFVECITQEPLPHKAEDVVVQKGNCMKDTVIQHICKECQIKVSEDTRYTESNLHQWVKEIVDGAEIEYCELCGMAK